jgi:cysteine-rich repeat protein
VTQVYFLRTLTHNNGLAFEEPSYDPNIYIDGSSEIFLYGNRMHSGGVGADSGSNSRGGLQIGSEHPTSKRVENVTIVNNLISGINYQGTVSTGLCYGTDTTSAAVECPPSGVTAPDNIKGITYAYNTILANNANGYVMYFPFIDSTANTFRAYNNIFYGDNGAEVNGYFSIASKYDFDYNQYYRRGGNTNIFDVGGTNCTLADWQASTGTCGADEDDNSAYGDPVFVTDSDTAPDVHISAGSPAVNSGTTASYTIPTWLPQTVKDDITQYGIKGSTQATYTEDNVATAPDRGFHYDYAGLTSTTVTMSSNAQNTVGTATVTFTCPKGVTALIMDDKVKVTFPSGFVLNSGGTSAATASTGISGTFSACTVSGQTITCPRTGDGDSEFPEVYTSHSLTISNIKTPNVTGTTGTFTVEVLGNIWGTADTRRAWNYSVPGITISSSGGATCGNSIIESGESCDDGNTTALDGCSATCQTETPTCGNSIVEYLEQCDDGNVTALDGCSDTCQIETPVCGNGVIESGETCDDGNTTASDGCGATCLTEASSTGHQINIGNLSCSKLIQH